MAVRSRLAPIQSGSLFPPDVADEGRGVLTVAELDATLRDSVRKVGVVVVEGEVTGSKGASPNGHVYFNLKDEREDACISCAMFRRDAVSGGGDHVVNGARVRVRGEPTVYAPRGSLQLVVSRVTLAGRGDLLLRREELKRKLAAEGLFEAARKRPLPTDPRVIGVVTSAIGAAFHDIVKVARGRGAVRILLASATVQGDEAPKQLCAALARLGRVREVDVIIIGRGGGSAEDLAAFDDEALARAIAACPKPVVAAVGHEIDWSVACLVADVRAATPSQAAELVVPDAAARHARLDEVIGRLAVAVRGRVGAGHASVSRLAARLRAPERRIALERQRLDDLGSRSTDALRARLVEAARRREQLDRRLAALHPRVVVARAHAELSALDRRLALTMAARLDRARRELVDLSSREVRAERTSLERHRGALSRAAEQLHAYSPLAVLARGYSITLANGPGDRAPRRALRDAGEVSSGEEIEVRLHRGSISARVTATHAAPGDEQTRANQRRTENGQR